MRRGAMYAGLYAVPSYLTRRGRNAIFQIRVPKHLDPDLRLSPISVALGPVREFEARRLATRMAGRAMDVFASYPEGSEGALVRDVTIATLAALDFDPIAFEDGDLLSRAVDAKIDAVIDLTLDKAAGTSHTVARNAEALGRYFGDLTVDERTARRHFGIPEPQTARAPDDGIAATLAALAKKVDAIADRMSSADGERSGDGKQSEDGPLFSEAADAYVRKLTKEKGADHSEIAYLRHRTAIWTTLMGDRPIGQYHGADLQDFVHEIMYLPPRVSDRADYDVSHVRDYVAEGKEAVRALANYDEATERWPGLSEATLRNTYASRIKTIVSEAAKDARIANPFRGLRLTVPPEVPGREVKALPTLDQLNEVFRVAAASGNMVDTLLPLLGFLTGRRIALLSFMHTSGIGRRSCTAFDPSCTDGEFTRECAVAKVRSVLRRNGRWETVPIKTDASRKPYVLHGKLEELGFVDWAASNSNRFVFERLMTYKDPADAAQKRMGRLFRDAGIDPETTKLFHGLRSMALDTMRMNKVDARTARMQVGHELETVHDSYGTPHLRDDEMLEIDALAFPGRVDFSPFRNLDWDRLASASLYRRKEGGKKAKNAMKAKSVLRAPTGLKAPTGRGNSNSCRRSNASIT